MPMFLLRVFTACFFGQGTVVKFRACFVFVWEKQFAKLKPLRLFNFVHFRPPRCILCKLIDAILGD